MHEPNDFLDSLGYCEDPTRELTDAELEHLAAYCGDAVVLQFSDFMEYLNVLSGKTRVH